jgi:hypothetical protein
MIERRKLPVSQAVVVLDNALLPVHQTEGADIMRSISAMQCHVLCR